MWLKVIGSIFIILSSSICGFVFSEGYKKRIQELRDLQQVLCFIKNEIVVFNNVLPEIFIKINAMDDFTVKSIFTSVINELNGSQFCSLESAWKNAVRASYGVLSLEKEDLDIIEGFGIMLEKTDIEGHKSNIEYLISRLEAQEQKAVEKQKKNEKLFRMIGMLSGLAVAIVLF